MADSAERARLISRIIGIGSSVGLLAIYCWLMLSMTRATQDLTKTQQQVDKLRAQEQSLQEQNISRTTERDVLEKSLAELNTQLASVKLELSKTQETQRNLQVAAENATPGEIQNQVLAAMRADSPKQRSEALRLAAKVAKEQKQLIRAEKLLEAAVGEYESAPALNALGRLLADTHRLREAERLYLRSAKADPSYVYPLHNLSHLMMLEHRPVEARAFAERALAVDPNYEPAKDIIAKLSEHQGSGAQ